MWWCTDSLTDGPGGVGVAFPRLHVGFDFVVVFPTPQKKCARATGRQYE